MIKSMSLTLLTGLICLQCLAVNYKGDYTWLAQPDLSIYQLDSIAESEVGLVKDHRIEMVYGETGNLEEYVYHRYLVYVNSEEAVERNNKIYVGIGAETTLLDYNARVIAKDGSITELGKDALLEGVDEDGSNYNYFAVSGATIGSVIEYFYLIQRPARYYGHYISFQRSIPILTSKFEISCPPVLRFAFLSENGLPTIAEDTTAKETNRWSLIAHNVPKEYNESFANNGGNEMRLVYHLDENVASGQSNILNYNKVTANLYASYLEKQPKSVLKQVKKILKTVNIDGAKDDRDKVLRIEHYVKTNFRMVDIERPNFSYLPAALKSHQLNEKGATLLFYHAFKEAGIPFEIVITSNRYRLRFDQSFEDYSYLDKYLIYFPTLEDYMSPSTNFDRLGVIPPAFLWNHGLFISEIEIAGSSMPISEIKFIQAPIDDHTQSNMDIYPTFSEDFNTTTIKLDQKLTGYYAQNTQPYIGLLEEEADQEIRESLVKHLYGNAEIKELKIENGGAKHVGRDPLLVYATIESPDFLERAGNKILFKAGDLIGPQAEMYQEAERQLDVENTFNRAYRRKIVFDIPEGYACKNLNKLIFDVKAQYKDKISCAFISNYTLVDGKVECNIHEYYKDIHLPKSKYEPYRNVINAAADFNKVVLVFEKL